jgi:hypothetical protein
MVVVLEMPDQFRHLTRLTAREDFIEWIYFMVQSAVMK